MLLPLTKAKQHTKADTAGNQGLYFNKFFDQWHNDFSKVIEPSPKSPGGKSVWLNKFKKINVSNCHASRIKELTDKLGGATCEYTSTGPFITGMGLSHPVENGFLWHHTLGVPYLPGSSVKGMIRAWAEHWLEEDRADIGRIFGRNDKAGGGAAAGNIIVFDALPVEALELYVEVITPHDGGWRIAPNPTEADAPSDWKSPKPIPFLALKEGAKFQFALAARKGAKDDDLEKAWGYLEQALEWIGAGAKTAGGFGRFMTKTKIEEQAQQFQKDKVATQKQASQMAEKLAAKLQSEEEERHANWIPAVGDIVKYAHGTGKHVVLKLEGNGDFSVTREDGTGEILSDTEECSLWVGG